MSEVCVLFAEGFEEIEAVAIVDVLRRADVDVTTLGVSDRRVTGSHGITIETDRSLAEASSEVWDMVILPGGMPGSTNLRDNPEVQKLLRDQASSGRRIANRRQQASLEAIHAKDYCCVRRPGPTTQGQRSGYANRGCPADPSASLCGIPYVVG